MSNVNMRVKVSPGAEVYVAVSHLMQVLRTHCGSSARAQEL